MPTLAMIHTVSWYGSAIIEPFARHWLEQNPGFHVINIMDDSLLAESLQHHGPTNAVIERMQHYVSAAVLAGADVVMSTCTTMGVATERARPSCPVPLFNIDEPMAHEAVRAGNRLGILATVPTSAPATRRLLEREARALGKHIEIETVINESAFAALVAGNRAEHDRIVHGELDRLAARVDAIVLGQVSLALIEHRPAGMPVLQVARSGFQHARELLRKVPAAGRKHPAAPTVAAC
jgi:aspartate/glutamate racemase